MTAKPLLLLLVSTTLLAAEFRSGQAARAVFGQASFSGHEAGVNATSLVVAGDRLYAADNSQHILTFDLSRLGDVRDDRSAEQGTSCAVCEARPIAKTRQSVMPGVAAVSVWGKTVAVADAAHHHVLIWRDATAPRLDRGPDVILGGGSDGAAAGPATLVDPVSVALDGQRLFVGDRALHRVLVWNTLPATGEQPADAVLGQPDFVTTAAAETPAADTVASPVAMASNGEDLFVADAVGRRILVFSPGDRSIERGSVINSASLSNGPLAPGTLVTISGTELSEITDSASTEAGLRLPRSLGGVEVIFDGVALPVLAVSPTDVQAQLPLELEGRSGASLYLRLEGEGRVRVTTAVSVKIVSANPGLFALGGSEPRAGILLHSAKHAAAGAPPVTEENPARPGELVTVWSTGLGAVFEDGLTVAAPVSAQINGQAAPVISARLAPESAGVYEVQVLVPAGSRGKAEARLAIAQNGFTSNTITFPVAQNRR